MFYLGRQTNYNNEKSFYSRIAGNYIYIDIKKEPHNCEALSLLGYPDSNQERQDQNLQCYHYTIAQ